MNQMSRVLAGIALSLAVSTAHSALISLSPASASAKPGSTVSFGLLVDFGTTTATGGAADIRFDPSILSFGSFVFDPAFGPQGTDSIPPNRDTLFDVIDLQSPGLVSIGFGSFGGLRGAFTAGQLSFNVAPGAQKGQVTNLTMAASQKWFGFDVSPINYTGASVTTITAVPEPTSALLFASGLAMLGMLRLRRGVGPA